MTNHRIPLLTGMKELAGTYGTLFCDVWGVVHNGVDVFDGAIDALNRFRAGGGHVVLITNAPRPAPSVIAQLTDLGVPQSAYDIVVTSGDVTRDMLSGIGDAAVFRIGPDRDLPLIEGLTLNFSDAGSADFVLCTGLNDDKTETPSDYEKVLSQLAERKATMFCANPDLVVHRGDALIPCAGALAKVYHDLGGKVVFAGKPHGPIYELCFQKLAAHSGRNLEKHEVLVVGDGMKTDILGARNAGIDALYVADGIHRDDIVDGDGNPDQNRLNAMFEAEAQPPVAAIYGLSW